VDAILRIVTLLRFLCFIALVYLSLHVIFSRLISKPDSKVLWFFSVLTLPLTRPVQRWIDASASDSRLRRIAMVIYGLGWMALLALDQVLKSRR
jgi:hypothetical protein